MIAAQTSTAENREYTWPARRHSRGGYRVVGEVSPITPADRNGHRRGPGRHCDDGCPLRDVLVLPAKGTAA